MFKSMIVVVRVNMSNQVPDGGRLAEDEVIAQISTLVRATPAFGNSAHTQVAAGSKV